MTFLVLIAAGVLAVWGLFCAQRGPITVGAFLFVVISAVVGPQFWHASVGPLPVSLDRMWLLLLAGAYVLQRWQRQLPHRPWTLADLSLLLLVSWLVVSLLTSSWWLRPPKHLPLHWSSPVWRLVGGYLMPLAIYWIVRNSKLERREVLWVNVGLAIFGLYLGITGILEITRQWQFVFPKHIADPTVGIHFGRARGPTGNGINYGHCISACLFATWLLMLQFSGWRRLLLGALLPLEVAGVYLCYTRSVWIGAVTGGFVVLLGTLPSRLRGPLILAAALGCVGIWAARDQLLGFQREYTANETRESASMRGSFAYVSWMMFVDHPLTGVGFGHFAEEKLDYLADRRTELELAAIRNLPHHNTFLSLLSESGPIALLLFLVFLGAWAYEALRIAITPWCPNWVRAQAILSLGEMAVYVAQMAFHELSFAPIQPALALLLAGMTIGLRQQADASTLVDRVMWRHALARLQPRYSTWTVSTAS